MRKLPCCRYSRTLAGHPNGPFRPLGVAVVAFLLAAVFPLSGASVARSNDEVATLRDGQRLTGRLVNRTDRLVFHSQSREVEIGQLLRIDVPGEPLPAAQQSYGKLRFWSGQAVPGDLTTADEDELEITLDGFTAMSVPRAIVAQWEPHPGDKQPERDSRPERLPIVRPDGRRQIDLDLLQMAAGDEVYGQLRRITPTSVQLTGSFGAIRVARAELRGIGFRRRRSPPHTITGQMVDVYCHYGWHDRCRLTGAMLDIDELTLELRHPYLGDVTLPRRSIRTIAFRTHCTHTVVDPTYYHLGNEMRPDFFVAAPEGNRVRIEFGLSNVPEVPAVLSCWVHDIEGVGSKYERVVAAGRLRTEVRLNDRLVGVLNDHVRGTPKQPVSVRMALPDRALKAGTNTLALWQTPRSEGESEYDDCGVQDFALEFERRP